MTEASDFLARRVEAARPELLKAVRPLAASDIFGDAPEPAGTCVLLWYRGTRYLITAAHVVELYPDRMYYIGTKTAWIGVPGPFRVNQPPARGREYDAIDLAFRPLDADIADQLDGCRFLLASELATNDTLEFTPPRRSKYLALGYPLNRFKNDRRLRQTSQSNVAYTGTLVSQHLYRQAKLTLNHNIVTDFDHKKVIGPKGLQQAPALEGMSGGGMFRFTSVERPGDVSPLGLAAIIIERRKADRLLVGTRIDVVLAAIEMDGHT